MGRLGDLFPEGERQEHVSRSRTSGRVLYLFCGFTSPPKEKYVVVVGFDAQQRPLLFIINSDIHPFIRRHPDLLNCQVRLSASDYGFLDHDSFADCSEVIDDFDYQTINEQLILDTGRIKGELSEDTKKEIARVVQAARTIISEHKGLILKSLE